MRIRCLSHYRTSALQIAAIAWMCTATCSAQSTASAGPSLQAESAVVPAGGAAPAPQREVRREQSEDRPREDGRDADRERPTDRKSRVEREGDRKVERAEVAPSDRMPPMMRPGSMMSGMPGMPGMPGDMPGARGMRDRAAPDIDDQVRSMERMLESPLFKRYVELLEQNANLRAQLEIRERLGQSQNDRGRSQLAERQFAERQFAEREQAERLSKSAELRREQMRQRESVARERGGSEPRGAASEVEALRGRIRELEARVRELTSQRPGSAKVRGDDDEDDEDED